MNPSPTSRRWLAALIAVLAAVLGVSLATPGDAPSPTPTPRTVTVDPGGPGKAAVKITPAAQARLHELAADLAAGNEPAVESGLNETARPSAGQIEASKALAPAGQPEIPAVVPLASAHTPGCTTALVRNYSSRNGAPVLQFWIHWTGSWLDGPSIVRWFDTAGSQASSHYYTDQQGRCWLMVAESQKAWTEANANSWGISDEIQNPGVLPLFRTAAARKIVVHLMILAHRDWGIPYQHGTIAQGPRGTCVVTRPGYLAHRDGGACAGSHPDVGVPSVVDALIAEAKRTDRPPARVLAARVACRKLDWHRRQASRARAHGARWWTRAHVARARSLKATIARGSLVCPAG